MYHNFSELHKIHNFLSHLNLQFLQAQQVHYDIIHSKGAKGKLVLRVAEE